MDEEIVEQNVNVRDFWSFDQYYNAVVLYSDVIDIHGADAVRMVLFGEMWVKYPDECAENGLTDIRTSPPTDSPE